MSRTRFVARPIILLSLLLPAGAVLAQASEGTQGKTQTVKLDGKRVRFTQVGQGGPTVVFESGLGDGMEAWRKLPEEIGEITTVFAYDRPGYGGSAPTRRPRDAAQATADLRDLLLRLDLPRPWLLVGHSLGGLFAEYFARTHPSDIAGLVLVDPRAADFTQRCLERLSRRRCGKGVVSVAFSALLKGAAKQEWKAKGRTQEQTRNAPPLSDLPIVVLSAGLPDSPAHEIWLETHAELAQQSSRGQHIVVEGSRHYVHHHSPGVVVAAVRELVEALREEQLGVSAEPVAAPGE